MRKGNSTSLHILHTENTRVNDKEGQLFKMAFWKDVTHIYTTVKSSGIT